MPAGRAIGRALTVVLLGAACAACGRENEDLTRAIGAGVGRTISTPPSRVSIDWLDVGVHHSPDAPVIRNPVSACWMGGTLVAADAAVEHLVLLSETGVRSRIIGGRGSEPGKFAQLSVVRCAPGTTAILTADLGLHRVSFFDAAGALLRTAALPDVPQIDILGDFSLASDGSWYESWLGSTLSIGPYLSDEEWQSVPLVRRYGADDKSRGGFGRPVAYGNTVARRVFNRVFMAQARDTLWVLTQGDATIHGFDSSGASIGEPVRLPVYYRGMEPDIDVGDGHPGSSFRKNEMAYHPNVQDLAVVDDSLFVTIRYRDWGWRMVGTGIGSLNRWAASSLEIVDRHGTVMRAYDVPGMAFAVETDGGSRVAVLTRLPDNSRHLLLSMLQM